MRAPKTVILGAMAITIVNASVGNLVVSNTKVPTVSILIGGYLVTIVLLVGSEMNEQVAVALALFVLFGSLFGTGNTSLSSVITKLVTNAKSINPVKGTSINVDGSGGSFSDGGSSGGGGGGGASAGYREPSSPSLPPLLVPIPNQPTKLMTFAAMTSFMQVQAQYGQTIWLDNTYRSFQSQKDAYAKDPNRYAKPETSLHVKGLALDINGNKTNANDPLLHKAFKDHGWFNVSKSSGPLHWSYGVAG